MDRQVATIALASRAYCTACMGVSWKVLHLCMLYAEMENYPADTFHFSSHFSNTAVNVVTIVMGV